MNLGELISQYPLEAIVATVGFVTIAILGAATVRNIGGVAKLDSLSGNLMSGKLTEDGIAVEFAKNVTPRRCQILSFLSRKQ